MANLFEELKRRKVFRVAIGYVVLGWALIQVADTIAPLMNLPEAAPRFVLFLLILMFPVALFLAWAFELRPTDGAAASGRETRTSLLLVAASIAVLGVAGWLLLWDRPEPGPELAGGGAPPQEAPPDSTAAPPQAASIAVLPFADLSPEGDQEHFGDGIAEELLNVLAGLDQLAVASRTSSFAFKGANRNVGEIADILNVAYVLEGSIRKAVDRVRVTAQLIDAGTDRHLWSETFDRELTVDNIFAIQDEIARSIVGALDEELGLDVGASVGVTAVTRNLDAYDLYLRAERLIRVASVENARRVVELLEQAVELDPEFVEAWGMLAQWTNWIPTWDHSLEPEPWHRRAVELGRHTLGLSEQNLPGWLAIASANFYLHQWEAWEQAASEIEQRFPQHIRNPEELMGMGYLERARASAARLAEGDPEDNFWELLIALYHTHIGQFETAVSHFERAILKGYSGGAEYDMAYAYLALGDSAVMTAVQSRWYEAWDPELLPLLPHIIQLMKAPPAEFGRAAGRFRIVAHELGFEEDDLLRPGPRWGIRAPHVVAMAYGRYDLITGDYWGNSPMFWMWTPALQRWRQSEAFKDRVRATGMLAFWQKHGWPDLCRPLGEGDFACD